MNLKYEKKNVNLTLEQTFLEIEWSICGIACR